LRVFVCEFVTGGGFGGEALPPGLAREGDMMLAALVKDVADVAGVSVVAARDARLRPPPSRNVSWKILPGDAEPWAAWADIIAQVDAVWPIAPETGGVLQRLSAMVHAQGKTLLGCPPSAVAVAASKLATARHLARRGVATPATFPLADAPTEGPRAWVVKPDDGAGCERTYFVAAASGLAAFRGRPGAEGCVAQAFVPGVAGSLSMICAEGNAWLLTCNSQDVRVENNRFHYRGGIVGGLEHFRAALSPLAAQVAAAMPDLWGYVGVDVVLGPHGPVVIDVNPRLTTSYVGLRAAIGANPAQLVFDLLGAAPRRWRHGAVTPQAVIVEAA
jgi:tyramine---L-glutamate ligase